MEERLDFEYRWTSLPLFQAELALTFVLQEVSGSPGEWPRPLATVDLRQLSLSADPSEAHSYLEDIATMLVDDDPLWLQIDLRVNFQVGSDDVEDIVTRAVSSTTKERRDRCTITRF